jgi:hypothetical protein
MKNEKENWEYLSPTVVELGPVVELTRGIS